MRPGEFERDTAFSIYLILIATSALTRTEFRNRPESTSSTERPRHSLATPASSSVYVFSLMQCPKSVKYRTYGY